MSGPVEHDLTSRETEMAVIGSVLVEPSTIAEVCDWLPVAAFADERCRFVYGLMLKMWERREPADIANVAAEIVLCGPRNPLGVETFLAECLTVESRWFWIGYYAEKVLRLAELRAVEEAAAGIVRAVHHEGQAFELDPALRSVREAAERFRRPAVGMTLAERVAASQQEAIALWDGEYRPRVVSTGIRRLDRILSGGFKPNDVVVLAARPSIGKTSVMLHVARRQRSLVCSLEMPGDQLVDRMIATEAGVPYDVRLNPVGDVGMQERWLAASEKVKGWPVMVRDDLRTTGRIEAEVERLRAEDAIDAVFVDHVGWLEDEFGPRASDYEKTSKLSRRCAGIAKRTGVPVVMLSQLNREVEGRPGCVPQMSDLRETGKLEEDATVVLLLYNRHYYASRRMGGLNPEIAKDYISGQPECQRLTIQVAKNRNGMVGYVDAGWDAPVMAVRDVGASGDAWGQTG